MPILVLRQCLRLALYLLFFADQYLLFSLVLSTPLILSVAFDGSDDVAGFERWRSVPDGVVGSETDPLRDGTVLLLGLGQLLLGAESLVGLYLYLSVFYS